ncbi:MAG: PAS domain-containing protein, partial [Verrucomicrobiota bacterium]|nr:PAS domain-containing protein [Verrucomicrobiota bacterium]
MKQAIISQRQKKFIEEIDSTSSFLWLLDSLDGLSFFAKDNEFRLIFANPYFYRRLGLRSEKELLGKNDFELFPEPLARKFRKDDEWVLTNSKPMTGLVELFLTQQGIPAWYQTNKFPIINRMGETIGVMGTVQRYEKTGLDLTKDKKIQTVMEQIRRD